MTALDICTLGDKEKADIILNAAKEFGYSVHEFLNVDDVFETTIEPTLMFVIESLAPAEVSVDELVQAGRQQFPHAFLILIVEKELTKDKSAFLERQGVKLTFLRHEVETGKVAFAMNQLLKASYVPLKSIDLLPDHPLPFTVYHLLPQRKKFLKLIRTGDSIEVDRLPRLLENPEFYLDRGDLYGYKKFIEETSDKSPKGLAKRCRANFVALQSEFTNLAFEVTDESSRVSFLEGQELLARCQKLCDDLLMNLAEFPRAWEVVNGSSIGEFGSLERAPSIAAFSGMLALRADMKRVEEIMMASLLVDMSVLTLSSKIAEVLRAGEPVLGSKTLTADEVDKYRRLSQRSIDLALNRKLSIPEKLRNIIVGVYEQADGKGFPNGINDQKIMVESQMIRFAKEFDSRIQVKMGRARKDPIEAMKEILDDPILAGVFSAEFKKLVLEKILGGDLSDLKPSEVAS
ncbi:MAG: HD domain-containing phosphohydrolase [Bdellovibrionales bacterium]|nr:HD domain-containing phosphohydrolase [Bdellovibrionales bacterium]